jgi:hypothetical protein
MSEVFLPPPPNTSILPIGYPDLVSYADAFDINGLSDNDSINIWPAPTLGLGRSFCTGENEWKAPLVGTLPTYKANGIGAGIPGVAWALAAPVSAMFQPQPFDQLHGAGGGAIFPNDYSFSSRPGLTAVIVVKPTVANISRARCFTSPFRARSLSSACSVAGQDSGAVRRGASTVDGSVNISAGRRDERNAGHHPSDGGLQESCIHDLAERRSDGNVRCGFLARAQRSSAHGLDRDRRLRRRHRRTRRGDRLLEPVEQRVQQDTARAAAQEHRATLRHRLHAVSPARWG